MIYISITSSDFMARVLLSSPIVILDILLFFFQEQFHRLGTKLSFSTANHPQTGGLTESVNRTVENVLRAFVNHKQDNWDKLLPL